MRSRALADTGALLALLDRRDRWHRACASVLPSLRLPLITSSAVLTELFHLVGDARHEVEAAWAFIRSDAVELAPIEADDLPDLDALMAKYADRPMDFADATLVHLAGLRAIDTVFTIDHDDFETYRIDGRRSFQIVPPRSR